MSKPHPVFGILATAAAVVLISCSSGSEAQNVPPGGEPGSATPVAVDRVARRDLAREVTLTGPVEPLRVVGVNSRMAGTILTVRVIEGDRVRPGTRMAELDARETAAQLERARAVRANAQTVFERAEQMQASQIITDAEFEQARASFETANSDVRLWETRLEFSRVLSPTGGVVTQKFVEAGSAVSPNERLFDVADDSLLVVRVRMSELDVVHVRPNDSVAVELDAYPEVRLVGRVRRVFPSADPQTRLVPVEVGLASTSRAQVRPGFLARVHFPLERRPGVVVVPASAVGTSALGPYVYVVAADTLARRPIQTGLTSQGRVEVLTGVSEGELVVTSGQLNLRPGARVRITAGPPVVTGDSSSQGEAGDLP
jgi:RND family efflux transporter MFP subunit